MKRVYLGLSAFMATMMIVVSAASQPPEGKEKKGPPDFKKDGPRGFQMGKVLPSFVRDELDLTDEQQKQIDSLERDVKSKLSKILTAAQIQKLQTMRPKGPPDFKKGPPDFKKGPPDGKDGPPDGKGKKDFPFKKDKDD